METKLKTWHEHNSSGGIDNYSNYMGDTSIKDMLVFLGRNRDSGILQESNFQIALEKLGGESDAVQVHRFDHWGCGWFELILIKPNAVDKIEIAESIIDSLSDYPVLDDQDYSERENTKVMDYWKDCSLRERIQLCKDCNIFFINARFDDLPYRNDRLYQLLAE